MGERAPEQATAPLFNKLARPLGSVLQAYHHVGEEAEVTGIIVRVGMRGMFVANGAQHRVGSNPGVLEHGGVHALQRLPPTRFLPALLHEGLGTGDPPLKRKQLSAGGGQLGLH